MSNYKGPYNSFSQNAEPIYSQSNILGTVSQSNGVPTGAIIERGSNTNGEFVKFADGTLICNCSMQSITIGANSNENIIFTLPATTVSSTVNGYVAGRNLGGTVIIVASGRARVSSPTTMDVRFLNLSTSLEQTASVSAILIGRWY